MTRFTTFLFTALVTLAFSAMPLLAAPAERPDPGWGYGPMWGPMGGSGWGWHPGMMIFGGVMMLLVLAAIVLLIVWLVRALTHHHGPGPGYRSHHHGGALDILAERLARGEINKEEFEEKRRLLLGR